MEALRYLTDDERERLLARAEERSFASGEVVLAQGKPQDAIHLVTSGTVRAERRAADGTVTVLDTLAEGEAFGQMSLLDGSITSATIAADDPVTVAILDLAAVADLLEDDPRLAAHLYQSLAVMIARRLRDRTDGITSDGR
jgi:cAMP-binding proteins - catabolite gene activator and regulatory subunit of cAMP-dependent protein kinases